MSYKNHPSEISEPNDWHEISFRISVDTEVDWDKVDLRQWAHTVAKFTASKMASSGLPPMDEDTATQIVKTLIMNVKVERISFVDDESLHNLIDEFGD